MFRPPPLRPPSRAARQAWLWCMAVLLFFKAAVPLLAAAAADRRGAARRGAGAGVQGVWGAHGGGGGFLADRPRATGFARRQRAFPWRGEHCAFNPLAAEPSPEVLPAVLAHALPPGGRRDELAWGLLADRRPGRCRAAALGTEWLHPLRRDARGHQVGHGCGLAMNGRSHF